MPVDPQQPTDSSDAPTPQAERTPQKERAQPPTRSGTKSPSAAPKDPLRRSRTSGAWIGIIALGIVLLLLIIFIAQNTQSVAVSFLGWNGTTPLAVAVLIAALAGLAVAATAGSLRIWQLRRRVQRLERSRRSGTT